MYCALALLTLYSWDQVWNIALGQWVLVGYYNEIVNNNVKPFTKYYGIDFGPSAPRRLRHNPVSVHGLAHSTLPQFSHILAL